MHHHVTCRDHRQVVVVSHGSHSRLVRLVAGAEMQGDGDACPPWRAVQQPGGLLVELFPRRAVSGQQHELAVRHATQVGQVRRWGREVVGTNQVFTLGRAHPRGGDQLAKIPIPVLVFRQDQQGKGRASIDRRDGHLAADHKLEPGLLRRHVRLYCASHRAFVGDAQRVVAQFGRPRHELVRR